MIAAQVTVVPADLKPVAVDESGWPQVAGTYRLGPEPGILYHACLRNGSLYRGSNEKSAKLLNPLSPLVRAGRRNPPGRTMPRPAAGRGGGTRVRRKA